MSAFSGSPSGFVRLLRAVCAAAGLVTLLTVMPAAAAGPRDSRDDLTALSLPDSYGRTRRLSEFDDKDILVVVFLGTECPLARLYGPRLQSLSERYQDHSVQFLGICANVQDTLTEIESYASRTGIQFPVLIDAEQKLADRLQATRTPEAVLLDRERQIVYRGCIDDQYGIGITRKAPSREFLAAAIDSVLQNSSPDPAVTTAVGCVIGRRSRPQPAGDITWSKHIAPIFNRRCVECHRAGEIAPFPLTSYAETVGWEATIAEVVDEGRMPPWNANPEFGHFRNDARLSDEEKSLIQTWIRNGCPEGDPADLPEPPRFTRGWRIPEPDQIIHVTSEPFPVKATGTVEYQYFAVDPGFSEDKYVVAAEARPGNPAVVHHIIAFLQLPGQQDISLGRMLIGYAPGTSPLIFPPDTAMKIPAGSRILFEMHYTPVGVEQTDRSSIGLRFADASQIRREVVGIEALNEKLAIPPGAGNHEVTAQRRLREDLEVLSLTPHMHLRGKSFRYDVIFPDGRTETLLDVPKYDFNWQLRYELQEPRLLPKGTLVRCTAHFDNSEANPNNPDPGKEVRWGQQSWEEMMIGFITAVKPAAP